MSKRYSFTPLWTPPFLSRLAPEDCCHLNGLALADGEPAYVSAVSRSDVAAGWRDRRHDGGIVIDIEDGEIVLGNLSMPHSPRVYDQRLWVLNLGTGELGFVDRARGRFEPVAFCPGFLRGLAVHDHYAIVGLSKQRRERTFAGLALDQRLKEKDAEARCGLWVIDLRSGHVVHWLELEGVVIELYDVAVLPGVRRPMALGFHSDEIQRLITIDIAPRPIFEALTSEASPSSPPLATHPPRGAGGASPAARSAGSVMNEAAGKEYALGNQLVKAGRFVEAIAHYEEAVRLQPDLVNALINLGTVHHRLGQPEAAAGYYLPARARSGSRLRQSARQPGDALSSAGRPRSRHPALRLRAAPEAERRRHPQPPGPRPL